MTAGEIITFFIILSILILVHELGHLLVARVFGVGVQVFSLGFGPSFFKKKIGQTTYKLCLIPLGGYVKMIGESEAEVTGEDKERSFAHKRLYERAAIVGAGPLSNLLFALLVFFLVFLFWGIPQLTTHIGNIKEGSPAERVGMLKGDRIVTIDGQEVSKWEEMSTIIRESKGGNLLIHVDRNGQMIAFTLKPEISTVTNIFGETLKVPLIGVVASNKLVRERVDPLRALYRSAEQSWNITKILVFSIIKLIQRAIPANTLGGPVLIAQITSQQLRGGLIPLVFFVGTLSINLGLINLLPIPILDGGHLFFFLIEMTLGRPVSMKKREIAQQIGLFMIILLMAFVFYNDISRLLLNQ